MLSESTQVTSRLQGVTCTSGIACGLDWLLCDTWSYLRTETSPLTSSPTPSTVCSTQLTYIYSGWMNGQQMTEKSLNFCEPQSSAKKSIPRRWCERAVLLAHFPEDNFNDIFSSPKVQDELPGSWYTWIKNACAHSLSHSFIHSFT